jgi:uncharacterized protein YktA (UPF0223 family)
MPDTRREDISKSIERFKKVIEAAKEEAKKIEEERKASGQSPR